MLRRPLLYFFARPWVGGGTTEIGGLGGRGDFVKFRHYLDVYAG